jgi:putative transposase
VLLTDNGSGYISRVMRNYLGFQGVKHFCAKAHHPQTIGKVERWHRTMKDEVTLVVHTSPNQLREGISRFVTYYNSLGSQALFTRLGGAPGGQAALRVGVNRQRC